MQNPAYADFLDTLQETDRRLLCAIHEHISCRYPQYKPYDVRPQNKSNREWTLNYRQKPKVGKPICNAYSVDGRLSLQFVFLTSMIHEVLLRQYEFSEKIRRDILRQSVCTAHVSCRGYGSGVGADGCAWRQHFLIGNRLIMTCPYPYIRIGDIAKNDLDDLRRLVDLQMKHMTQNAKDIKGSGYVRENAERCGEVTILPLDEKSLGSPISGISEYFANPKRLEKYAALYHIVPMGAGGGFWFYQSDESVRGGCGKMEFCFARVPPGRYATATVEDPMNFSLVRTWNYICKWVTQNRESIDETALDGIKTACLARFYRQDDREYMTMYVPLRRQAAERTDAVLEILNRHLPVADG